MYLFHLHMSFYATATDASLVTMCSTMFNTYTKFALIVFKVLCCTKEKVWRGLLIGTRRVVVFVLIWKFENILTYCEVVGFKRNLILFNIFSQFAC